MLFDYSYYFGAEQWFARFVGGYAEIDGRYDALGNSLHRNQEGMEPGRSPKNVCTLLVHKVIYY